MDIQGVSPYVPVSQPYQSTELGHISDLDPGHQ
jgi:hypothetical protein